MKVPFHKPFITDDEINAVVTAMRSGWTTMGEVTIEFENKFSSYLNVEHAVALNSCTAALHLALKVVGIKEGDEVIVPAICFASAAEVVTYFNAIPVIADVDADTHLISCTDLEMKITGKTKAVIPVHYGGQPCDMDRIMDIAGNNNLHVIEDAAHALPSRYNGKQAGSLGDISCFSFYATKTLSTGEGGMAATNNEEWAERMRILRLHGISKDAWKRYTDKGSWMYDVIEPGYKYNTSDINSSMGIEQLKKIDLMWKKRLSIAERYNSAFDSCEELIPYVVHDKMDTSWHLYPLKLKIEKLGIDRNQFIELLKQQGVGSSVHFIPLYHFRCYGGDRFLPDNYPNSEWIFERLVSLPIYPGMTDEEVNFVIEKVLNIIKENRK